MAPTYGYLHRQHVAVNMTEANFDRNLPRLLQIFESLNGTFPGLETATPRRIKAAYDPSAHEPGCFEFWLYFVDEDCPDGKAPKKAEAHTPTRIIRTATMRTG